MRGVPRRDEEELGRRSPSSSAMIVRPVGKRPDRVRLQTLAHDGRGNRLRRAARHAGDIAGRRHAAAVSFCRRSASRCTVSTCVSAWRTARRSPRAPDRRASPAGSESTAPRGACRPGRRAADRRDAATPSAAGIFRLSWMWQTQTSPVSSSPRIRSRVASASALNSVSISHQLLRHIYCLDKYITAAYSLYIRLCSIQGASVMSDIQQAVREKYGAIAAVGDERVDQHRLLRPDAPAAAAIRSPRICTRTPRPAACRRRRWRRRSAAATRPPCSRSNRARRCSTSGSGGGIDVLLSAQTRRADRQGLRPRHDRRDAGAGAREPAEGRRDERRVPEGHDRSDSRCPTTRSTSSSRTA